MGQYTSYYLYQKYEKRGDQPFTPVYPMEYSVDGNGTMSLVTKNDNDPNCGYSGDTPSVQYRWVNAPINVDYVCDECPEPIYRTTSGTPYCDGYNRTVDTTYQVSYDEGETWNTLSSGSTVLAYDSPECGYPIYQWVDTDDYVCEGEEPPSPSGDATKYLTFEIVSAGTIVWGRKDTQCSTDNGQTWTTVTNSTMNVNAGDKILVKSINQKYDRQIMTSATTAYFKAYNNIMSLIYSDNFIGQTTIPEGAFFTLFQDNTHITDASGLVMPATTLDENCYADMFHGCTNLRKAPQLPATSLAQFCYLFMFADCTSLTSAPALPATTMAKGCYRGMFGSCTSLTTAPALPATTLADSCYEDMFAGCTSLTSAPQLPATTMEESCYQAMFDSCTSLTTAPALPATTLADSCYYFMFGRCTNLRTAPSLPATTLADWCYHEMFVECTNLRTAPALPATTLADYCYQGMFIGCTSLSSAPSLPATALTENCYYSMFSGCTSLTSAPTLPATVLADSCYGGMFENCTNLTSTPSLPAMTLANGCYEGMFIDCTSLTIAPTLPATTLAEECYMSMFHGCTNLSRVTCLATDISAFQCTGLWLLNVAEDGTFVKASGMNDWSTGVDGIPDGWTVQNAS